MAVYVTGDKHQRYEGLLTKADFLKLNENDVVIVLGDMGLFWRRDKRDANSFIKYFEENYKFNLYFVDGNHENFKLLNALEEDENGMGYVSEHIRHLKRGRRYNIQGKDILAIGGADSIDQYRREPNISWWKEEIITDDEVDMIDAGHYDYVLSHSCPISVFNEYKWDLCEGNVLGEDRPEFKVCNNQLEKIKNFITFDHWYFGHYHVDKDLDDEFTCLYHGWKELI